MSLRRFPWKLPRMTDNSYRLFASPPNDESVRRLSDHVAKSTSDINNARERDTEAVQEDEEVAPDTVVKPEISRQRSLKNGEFLEPQPEVKKPEVIKGMFAFSLPKHDWRTCFVSE
jgi:hypothetical protein